VLVGIDDPIRSSSLWLAEYGVYASSPPPDGNRLVDVFGLGLRTMAWLKGRESSGAKVNSALYLGALWSPGSCSSTRRSSCATRSGSRWHSAPKSSGTTDSTDPLADRPPRAKRLDQAHGSIVQARRARFANRLARKELETDSVLP
jgi:hypothetical protein